MDENEDPIPNPEQEPEMGRFIPKGEGDLPRDPFPVDELFDPDYEPEYPSLKALHVPSAPIEKKKLKSFLIELEPIIREIQSLSRKDQHLLGRYLQDVKNNLHASNYPSNLVRIFEKMVDHFNDLLRHSQPVDKTAALEKLTELEKAL